MPANSSFRSSHGSTARIRCHRHQHRACSASPCVGSLYWHDPSHVMQAKQVDWRTQLMRGIQPSACLPGSNAISILLGENEECESGGLEFEKRFEDDVNSKAKMRIRV